MNSKTISGSNVFFSLCVSEYSISLSKIPDLWTFYNTFFPIQAVMVAFPNDLGKKAAILLHICSRILKYNSKLYSDNFTVKLSQYNFHCRLAELILADVVNTFCK